MISPVYLLEVDYSFVQIKWGVSFQMTSSSEGTEKQFLKNESVMKLVESLLENEDSLNFGSLLPMANKLIKDETLMELVGDIGKSTDELKEEQDPYLQEDHKLYVLQKQLEDMKKELTLTKQELADLKKQDTSIFGLGIKVIHAASQDLKKGVNILTGFGKLLK